MRSGRIGATAFNDTGAQHSVSIKNAHLVAGGTVIIVQSHVPPRSGSYAAVSMATMHLL